MIYLDYTATTPMDDEIIELYKRMQKDFFANSSSLNKLGQRSDYMINKCKEEIFDVLKIKKSDIIFTSNATEANNLAILGYLSKYKTGHLITTKIEHPSVFEVFKHLEDVGFSVSYLDIKEDGKIDINELKKALTKETLLVSIMWVNNIIGSIQPINEVIKVLKDYPKCKLHVDCVQGLCKVLPNFDFNEVDLLTFSAHKIFGPKGIGALIKKKNVEVGRILFGSSVQLGLKPGTMDVGLVACTCKAIKKYYPKTLEHFNYVKSLEDYLVIGLKHINGLHINFIGESPYIVNISIPHVNGETTLHRLEDYDIYVSTGSSCASKLKTAEKTVLALTKDEDLALSSIRISLSHLTKKEEIDRLLNALERIV